MTPEALDLSANLRDELEANDREAMSDELREELETGDRRTFVADTRQVPARFHHLLAMASSPAHCRSAMQHDGDRDTLAMRLGAGVHAMAFGKPVVRYEGKRDKRTKAYKAFLEAHPNTEIMSPSEWRHAERMSSALRSHELAGPLLFGPDAIHETTIGWTQQGRARRSTPDVRNDVGSYVVELKTTRCAEPWRFKRDALRRAYHAQLADQMAAVEAHTGVRPRVGHIVAIESTPPYAIVVFTLTDRLVDLGDRLCRSLLDRLLLSEATGQWPGYALDSVEFDVPEEVFEIEAAA